VIERQVGNRIGEIPDRRPTLARFGAIPDGLIGHCGSEQLAASPTCEVDGQRPGMAELTPAERWLLLCLPTVVVDSDTGLVRLGLGLETDGAEAFEGLLRLYKD